MWCKLYEKYPDNNVEKLPVVSQVLMSTFPIIIFRKKICFGSCYFLLMIINENRWIGKENCYDSLSPCIDFNCTLLTGLCIFINNIPALTSFPTRHINMFINCCKNNVFIILKTVKRWLTITITIISIHVRNKQ